MPRLHRSFPLLPSSLESRQEFHSTLVGGGDAAGLFDADQQKSANLSPYLFSGPGCLLALLIFRWIASGFPRASVIISCIALSSLGLLLAVVTWQKLCVPPLGYSDFKDNAGSMLCDRGEHKGRACAVASIVVLVFACGWRSFTEERSLSRSKFFVSNLHYKRVEVEGEIATDPKRIFGSQQFTLRAEELGSGTTFFEGPLRLQVRTKEPAEVSLGDRVRISGLLAPLPVFNSTYLERTHVVAVLRAETLDVRGPPRRLILASNWVRQRLTLAVRHALSNVEGSLMLGLLLGDDSALPAKVKRSFTDSGMSHLTAVSGQNFAVVLGMAAFVIDTVGQTRNRSRRFETGGWLKKAWLLGVALFYAMLTRWEPSVMRASAMVVVALCCFNGPPRRHKSLEVLSLSLGLLVIVDPFLADSAGFQLSVAATAGILISGLRWANNSRAHISEALGRRGAGPLLVKLLSLLVGSAAISLAAQLYVWPILFWRFGTFQPSGAVSNLVAVPLAEAASLLGYTLAIPAVLLPEIAGKVYFLSDPLLSALVITAQAFSRFPKLEVTVAQLGRGIIAGSVCWLFISLVCARAIWKRRDVRPHFTTESCSMIALESGVKGR